MAMAIPLTIQAIQVAESEVPAREGALEGWPKRPDLRPEKTNDVAPRHPVKREQRKAVRL